MIDPTDKILTGAAAIAEELSCTPRQVYRLADERRIPVTQLRGSLVTTRNALRSYIAALAKASVVDG
jgi:hypothetical protein